MSVNKVMLMGNLTRDPELRHTSTNSSVTNFGLAVNRRYRTRDGQEREEVTFVDVEVWGRLGEVIAEHLRKGDPIFVEGRLKLEEWQDSEGKKRSKLRVVLEQFSFVGSKK